MSVKGNHGLLLRIYCIVFVASVAGAALFLVEKGETSGVAATVAIGILSVFGVFGLVLAKMLHSKVTLPHKALAEYTVNVLEGRYEETDEKALALAAPGLGELVGTLAARYKERLGFSSSMLEGLPVPIVTVDTGEHITFLNKECLEMIGSTEDVETYHGRMISQIFYQDDRKSVIGTCMEEGTRLMNHEAIFKTVDGEDINVLANLFPLSDVEGNIIGGCCLYLVTTEIKRHEAEIISQNERIGRAANEATKVSEELAAAAEQLEKLVSSARTGTCAQTERTGETATAMDEMNATVLEVARHANDAAEDANEARSRAEEGARIVTEVVGAIHEVATHAGALKSSMEELDERAESIGKVLGVIEDIADQTNLLALNAAIEAARAGEAGRGFAVVADEVRKLAEKTMLATNEVHDAIQGIQDGARKNVHATEVAVSSVEKSTEMAGRSGEALSSIVTVAESTADRVRSIATAAEQQSAASEEINRATMDVNQVCGETDLLMVEAAEAIERVAKLADTLTQVVGEMQ